MTAAFDTRRLRLLAPLLQGGTGGGTPGTAAWGLITGTLGAQTDLQAALDGKFSAPVTTIVAVGYAETATTGFKVIAVSASGQTITLPTAVGNTALFAFKFMVAGTLTIAASGAQTIDGAGTAVLVSQYASITVKSDNANWMII